MSPLVAFHLTAASAATVLGAAVLLRPKGTAVHKAMGRVWVALMAATAISSFWITEIRHGAGFSPIHALSVLTLVALVRAIWAIRRGDVRTHKRSMLIVYASTAIAGAFTLLPSRIVGGFFFGS